MKKTKFCLLCLCFPILLSGCWDSVNIEDRGFIVGAAIDIEEENNDDTIFAVTNQMVLPEGIGSTSQSGGSQSAFINFTTSSHSIYKIDEEIASRSSKQPFYEHLVMLVVSEDVARADHLFSELLDTYIRDVDFRRGINVVVYNGQAKELLDFTTDEDKLPAVHLNKILEQGSKQAGGITPKNIGDLEEYHLTGNSYVLPYVEITDVVVLQKGAVFHGSQDKMVGVLNQDELIGLELVYSNQHVKIIDFDYHDNVFAVKVIRSNSKVTADPSDLEDIKVKIDIQLEGTIKESFNQLDLTKSSEVEAVQDAIAKKIKKLIEQSIEKAQGELGADVFDIWKVLEAKHYDTWVDIRDNWEDGEYYFKNVSFDIEVTPQIYSIGTTNKTKKKRDNDGEEGED